MGKPRGRPGPSGARGPCRVLVVVDNLGQDGHQIDALLRVEWCHQPLLHTLGGITHLQRGHLALGCDPQQFAAAVAGVGLAADAAAFFEPPNYRARCGSVERHAGRQRDLVFTGPCQQLVQDGELHRRHVKPRSLFHEKRHGSLVGTAHQVAWRVVEIEALCHGRECSAPQQAARAAEEHAKKRAFTGREPPFFFMKPADAIVVVNAGETGQLPYPSLTANLHHEVELVVAIGKGGKNTKAADALAHICGYAVGLDMTRRDLQNDMKKQGRPWCIGKGFDASAPIGPIPPAAQAGDVAKAAIWLQVNGADKQRSSVAQLIWNIAETIEHLSAAWELQPGDLIYTGTPEGVGAVVRGDVLEGGVEGLGTLRLSVV